MFGLFMTFLYGIACIDGKAEEVRERMRAIDTAKKKGNPFYMDGTTMRSVENNHVVEIRYIPNIDGGDHQCAVDTETDEVLKDYTAEGLAYGLPYYCKLKKSDYDYMVAQCGKKRFAVVAGVKRTKNSYYPRIWIDTWTGHLVTKHGSGFYYKGVLIGTEYDENSTRRFEDDLYKLCNKQRKILSFVNTAKEMKVSFDEKSMDF